MPTVTPDPPEHVRRIALTAAAHTLADIFADEKLPLETWRLTEWATLDTYVASRERLATWAKWLDAEIETMVQPTYTAHRTIGTKAGVEIRVVFLDKNPPAGGLALVARYPNIAAHPNYQPPADEVAGQ